MRNTIGRPFRISGTGLHTGTRSVVTVEPATAGHGITFYRSDLPGRPAIPANLDSVVSTERRTVLGVGSATVSTVEHLLAAVNAHQIDDLSVVVEGHELPQGDGSANAFADSIARAGVVSQDGSMTQYAVRDVEQFEFGSASYAVQPSETLEIDVSIEWEHPVIGMQTFRCVVSRENFDREMAGARTFGFVCEMETLRRKGLIRGVTSHSVIALSADRVIHGCPLRWPNEFARHKALDLVGDLALLNGVLTAKIVAHKPSHSGNVSLANAIRDRAHHSLISRRLVAGGLF